MACSCQAKPTQRLAIGSCMSNPAATRMPLLAQTCIQELLPMQHVCMGSHESPGNVLHLAGQGGNDGLGVDQRGVAQVVQTCTLQ